VGQRSRCVWAVAAVSVYRRCLAVRPWEGVGEGWGPGDLCSQPAGYMVRQAGWGWNLTASGFCQGPRRCLVTHLARTRRLSVGIDIMVTFMVL